MSEVLAVRAPCKLNLGLRVIGRRPDGLHELETIFVALDWCDELRARRRTEPGIGLQLHGEVQAGLGVTSGDDNLVARAGRAFLAAAGLDGGFDVLLRKCIPAGGGLGGGSSDAAAMLRLAQALTGAPLTEPQLAALALSLGADVPFFLRGPLDDSVCCFARGVGEQLWPVPTPLRRHFVLIVPPFGTPTGAVFRTLDVQLTASASSSKVPGTEAPTATELALIESGGNQLEEAAMRCTPDLRALRDGLAAAPPVGFGLGNLAMSGSGSTLFVACESAARAADLAARVRTFCAERRPGLGRGVRVLEVPALTAPIGVEPSSWASSRDSPTPPGGGAGRAS